MSLYFGILYWVHPVKKELEFIVAQKKGKGDVFSLFYHESDAYANKFFGDLLGLVGPFDKFSNIITKPELPNFKTIVKTHHVFYLYIPYNLALIKALNGFKYYLDQCTSGGGIVNDCKKYPYSVYTNYNVFSVATMKDMIAKKKFGVRDLEALSNFSGILPTLMSNVNLIKYGDLNDSEKKIAQKYLQMIKTKKNKNLADGNDPKYIQTLMEQHRKYIQSLKPEYRQAVSTYTASGYSYMNAYLRGTMSAEQLMSNHGVTVNEVESLINRLNQVLNNAPPLTQNIMVYRGVNFDTGSLSSFNNLKVGNVIDIFRDTFNSTSFDRSVSINNFAGDECCLFILYLPVGTKGLYVNQLSSYSHENEYILAPGPLFRVMKYKHEKVPATNISSSKPDLRQYRLYCEDCEEVYEKYNNIVYYKLSIPAFITAKSPQSGEFKEPIHQAIDTAGLVVPKLIPVTKTKKEPILGPSYFEISKYTKNPAVWPKNLLQNKISTSYTPKKYGNISIRPLDVSFSPETIKDLTDGLKLKPFDLLILELFSNKSVLKDTVMISDENPIKWPDINTYEGLQAYFKSVNILFNSKPNTNDLANKLHLLDYKPHTINLITQVPDFKLPTGEGEISSFISNYKPLLDDINSFIPNDSIIYQSQRKYSMIEYNDPISKKAIDQITKTHLLYIIYCFGNGMNYAGLHLIYTLCSYSNKGKAAELLGQNIYGYLSQNNIPVYGHLARFDNELKAISEMLYRSQGPKTSYFNISPSIKTMLNYDHIQWALCEIFFKSGTYGNPSYYNYTTNDIQTFKTLLGGDVLFNLITTLIPFNSFTTKTFDDLSFAHDIDSITKYDILWSLSRQCPTTKPNEIYQIEDGKCIPADSKKGATLITQSLSQAPILTPVIITLKEPDTKYTSNLNAPAIAELKKLINQGPCYGFKSSIYNASTNSCISLNTVEGTKYLEELDKKYYVTKEVDTKYLVNLNDEGKIKLKQAINSTQCKGKDNTYVFDDIYSYSCVKFNDYYGEKFLQYLGSQYPLVAKIPDMKYMIDLNDDGKTYLKKAANNISCYGKDNNHIYYPNKCVSLSTVEGQKVLDEIKQLYPLSGKQPDLKYTKNLNDEGKKVLKDAINHPLCNGHKNTDLYLPAYNVCFSLETYESKQYLKQLEAKYPVSKPALKKPDAIYLNQLNMSGQKKLISMANDAKCNTLSNNYVKPDNESACVLLSSPAGLKVMSALKSLYPIKMPPSDIYMGQLNYKGQQKLIELARHEKCDPVNVNIVYDETSGECVYLGNVAGAKLLDKLKKLYPPIVPAMTGLSKEAKDALIKLANHEKCGDNTAGNLIYDEKSQGCVLITSSKGSSIVIGLKNKYPIPIKMPHAMYTIGINQTGLDELKEVVNSPICEGQPDNYFLHVNGQCLSLDSVTGQQYLTNLKSKYPKVNEIDSKYTQDLSEDAKNELKKLANHPSCIKHTSPNTVYIASTKQCVQLNSWPGAELLKQLKIKYPITSSTSATIPNIESKFLEGLSAPVVTKLKELSVGCEKNKFKSLKTGKCVVINSVTGKKALEDVITEVGKLPTPTPIPAPAPLPTGVMVPSSQSITIPTIEAKYLVGLSQSVLSELKKLAEGCEPNKFKSPKTQKCVVINSVTGQKILKELIDSMPVVVPAPVEVKIEIPNIEAKYLTDLPKGVLLELKKLAEGCPKNKFKSPKTQKCVSIESVTGKLILTELIGKINVTVAIPAPIPAPVVPPVIPPSVIKPNKPSVKVDIPNIESKYLTDLPYNVLIKLKELAVGCEQNKFKSLKTGKCIVINSTTGKKVLEDLKQQIGTKIDIPNIDPQYLENLSDDILIKLKELTVGCEHNKFKSPKTGKCVIINSTTGQKILKEMSVKVGIASTGSTGSTGSIDSEYKGDGLFIASDPAYLRNLEPAIVAKLIKLGEGKKERLEIHDLFKGNYINIESDAGLAVINYFKKELGLAPIERPVHGVDDKYLKGLSPKALQYIKDNTIACPYNKVMSNLSDGTKGSCVLITYPPLQKYLGSL